MTKKAGICLTRIRTMHVIWPPLINTGRPISCSDSIAFTTGGPIWLLFLRVRLLLLLLLSGADLSVDRKGRGPPFAELKKMT